jgi:hypothetical protein
MPRIEISADLLDLLGYLRSAITAKVQDAPDPQLARQTPADRVPTPTLTGRARPRDELTNAEVQSGAWQAERAGRRRCE